nr:hypothetical protein [uncultured Albidiferax sp.]
MSHRKTSPGTGAPMLAVIAIVWNALAWGLVMPEPGLAEWFKGVAALTGVGLAVGTLLLWLSRLRGNDVTLQLSQDPVPHGVPTMATFTLTRPLRAQAWTLLATIDSPDEDMSGFGRVWERKFMASPVPTLVDGELMVQAVTVEFTLPTDLPGSEDDLWYVSLVLQGDEATWPFHIETQAETSRATGLDSGDEASDSLQPDTNAPSTSDLPEPDYASRLPSPAGVRSGLRWVRRGAFALSLGVVGWIAWRLLLPMWSPDAPPEDWPVMTMSTDSVSVVEDAAVAGVERARGVDETDASWRLSARIRTPEFGVLLSNWLLDDGHLRVHLQGQAQVNRGELRMRIQQLALAPASACKPAVNCRVESIRLVLSQAASDGTTTTLAQSEPLPWMVDLAKDPVALRSDGIFQLTLPQSLAGDQDVRLQLVVQTANADGHSTFLLSDDTTYASNGNYMGLQLALRAASPQAGNLMDPCDRVGSLGEAVRAHCEGQVQFRLDSNAFSGRKELDAALIDAIKHYNSAAVGPLLKAGASPNAVDPGQRSISALILATFGDQQEVRAALIKAGAKV